MIRLRQSIERGMRHRWLGPLFVVLFVLLLVMTAIHAIHDGDHMASGAGDFCLGLTVVFGFLVVIRLRWSGLVPVILPTVGRAPPVTGRLAPPRPFLEATPVPLRL